MARRMFSEDIVGSDAFLEIPTSSRELYFQLGMYADDDGFVNPKKIIRITGASDDDIKVLLAKRFLLHFENGVVVIKHWLIHNMIRKDRYKETQYTEQKKQLKIKENRAYTELRQPSGNQMATQYRLGKDRLGKDSIDNTSDYSSQVPEIIKLFTKVNKACEDFYGNKTQRKYVEKLIDTYGHEKVIQVVSFLPAANLKLYNKATTPKELWDKWAKIEAEAQTLKISKTKIVSV
jgi:hypothetical protein